MQGPAGPAVLLARKDLCIQPQKRAEKFPLHLPTIAVTVVQAIDLIDEAGSRVRLQHAQLPEEARELDKELRALLKEKEAAVRGQDFEKAGTVRPCPAWHATLCCLAWYAFPQS